MTILNKWTGLVLVALLLTTASAEFSYETPLCIDENSSTIPKIPLNESKAVRHQAANTTDTYHGECPLPVSYLSDWLGYPEQQDSALRHVLVIGGRLPDNTTVSGLSTFDFVADIGGHAPMNDSAAEEIAIINFLLDARFSLLNNLTVTWIGVEFRSFNASLLISYIASRADLSSVDCVLVTEHYYGSPSDLFNQFLAELVGSGVLVVTTAVVSQTGGDFLCPASNPYVIAVSPLLADASSLDDYQHEGNLAQYYTSALHQHEFRKVTPDFVVPGVSLIQTLVGANGIETSQVLQSIHLPAVSFLLGYLLLRSCQVDRSPWETLSTVIRSSRPIQSLHIACGQQGYGLPTFSAHSPPPHAGIRPFSVDPFGYDADTTVTTVTNGQFLDVCIEIAPFWDSMRLKQIIQHIQGEKITTDITIAAQSLGVVEEYAQQNTTYAWKPPLQIRSTVQIFGIRNGLEFFLDFVLDLAGEEHVERKILRADNNRRLVGVVTYLEHDGVYSSEDPTGRLYPALLELHRQKWTISMISSRSALKQETASFLHDVLLVADPDIYVTEDRFLMEEYIENAGSILLTLDSNPSAEGTESQQSSDMLLGSKLPDGTQSWLEQVGIDIEVWVPPEENVLMLTEAGTPNYFTPYGIVPWIPFGNIVPQDRFFAVPYRGYKINLAIDAEPVGTVRNLNGSRIFAAELTVGQGLLTVLGTTSPLVAEFDPTGIMDLSLPPSGEWLDSLLLAASGVFGCVSITDINNPDLLQSNADVSIDVELLSVAGNQERWWVQIAGEGFETTVVPAMDGIVSLVPSFMYQGNTNITADLMFAHRIVDVATEQLSVSVNRLERAVVAAAWASAVTIAAVVVFTEAKTKRNEKSAEDNTNSRGQFETENSSSK